MLNTLSRWKYLQLLSGVYLAMFLIRVAFGVVIITFGHYVTANDFVFGLLVSAGPAFELIAVIVTGVIVDRYGRKGVLLAGLALGALSLYMLALVKPDDFLLIGVAQAIHGVAAAFILVTTLAIIASYAPPDKRGREMGLFTFVNMFGWFAGFAMGSLLLDYFTDLRYTFVLAGFLATLGLIYGHLNIREPERRGEVERLDFGQLARVFSNKRVQVLSLAWLVVFLFIGGLITFFSRVAVAGAPGEAAGEAVAGAARQGTQAALVILGSGALFMVSQLVFGWLSDRTGRERMMLVGALGFLGFMVTALLGMDVEPTLSPKSSVVPPLLLLGGFFTLAFAPSALAALADEATKRTEGTTMSAYSIVLNVGFIAAPTLVGGLRTSVGTRGVIWFFVGTAVFLVALVLIRFYQVRDGAAGSGVEPATLVSEAGPQNR